MTQAILINSHEIVLKGRNRPFFERLLVENIKKAIGLDKVKMIGVRVLIEDFSGKDPAEILPKIARIFGVANFYLALRFEKEEKLENLAKAIWDLIKERSLSSFKVETNRADKNYPLGSMAVNEKIGKFIVEKGGLKVNLKNPDLIIFIDILPEGIFVYFEKFKGLGGLPVGVSGRAVSLISGGFDSPVAAWQMMKRGLEVVFVHFHSWPKTSLDSQDIVKEIVRRLSIYQFGAKLYLVPFLEIQEEIVKTVPAKLRVIIYRWFMLKISELVAEKEQAQALITGEALGQVASQTIENLGAISAAVKIPIFRPLISFDKEEIIDLSRQIGLYELSSQPFDDCCSLFVPEHPETKAKLNDILIYEQTLKLKKKLKKALTSAQIIEVRTIK